MKDLIFNRGFLIFKSLAMCLLWTIGALAEDQVREREFESLCMGKSRFGQKEVLFLHGQVDISESWQRRLQRKQTELLKSLAQECNVKIWAPFSKNLCKHEGRQFWCWNIPTMNRVATVMTQLDLEDSCLSQETKPIFIGFSDGAYWGRHMSRTKFYEIFDAIHLVGGPEKKQISAGTKWMEQEPGLHQINIEAIKQAIGCRN